MFSKNLSLQRRLFFLLYSLPSVLGIPLCNISNISCLCHLTLSLSLQILGFLTVLRFRLPVHPFRPLHHLLILPVCVNRHYLLRCLLHLRVRLSFLRLPVQNLPRVSLLHGVIGVLRVGVLRRKKGSSPIHFLRGLNHLLPLPLLFRLCHPFLLPCLFTLLRPGLLRHRLLRHRLYRPLSRLILISAIL